MLHSAEIPAPHDLLQIALDMTVASTEFAAAEPAAAPASKGKGGSALQLSAPPHPGAGGALTPGAKGVGAKDVEDKKEDEGDGQKEEEEEEGVGTISVTVGLRLHFDA